MPISPEWLVIMQKWPFFNVNGVKERQKLKAVIDQRAMEIIVLAVERFYDDVDENLRGVYITEDGAGSGGYLGSTSAVSFHCQIRESRGLDCPHMKKCNGVAS